MALPNFPVRLPADVLEALGEFTGLFWSSLELEPIICDAIQAYMKAPPKPDPADQQQLAAHSEAGYQWKQLFLPEGTRLRARFGGQPYFAAVKGAEIRYGERAVSPSCFANLFGSGNRNAWKAVWLCLPGSTEWLLADVLRSARKGAIARLLGSEANTQGPSPQHTAGNNPLPLPLPLPLRRAADSASDQCKGDRLAPQRQGQQRQSVQRSSEPGLAAGRPPAAQGGRRRKRRAKKHGPQNPAH